MRTSSIAATVAVLSLAGSVSAAPAAEEAKRAQDAQASSRAAAVTEAFRIAWDGYYKYAFPHDQLHPIDNGEDDN